MPAYSDPTIITLTGSKPGPTIMILAGLHGNEICGLEVVRQLSREFKIRAGTLILAFGNLAAIALGKREAEVNMNRVFGPPSRLSAAERSSYEFRRARALKPYLNRCEALLDIHSTSNDISTPFVVTEPSTTEISQFLPFPIVSFGWKDVVPGSAVNYVIRRGGRAMAIECGNHNSVEAPKLAHQATITFLRAVGIIDGNQELRCHEGQKRVIFDYIAKTRVDYRPAGHFPDFAEVRKGTLIGYDGDQELLAPYDGVIIFTTLVRTRPNEEAFIFGRYVE